MKQRLVRWLGERSRGAVSDGRPCFVRPVLERLEDRQLLSAGQLDPTFGNGGMVLGFGNPNNAQVASHAVLQPDGKIVETVDSVELPSYWNGTIVVERFNPNGSLDGTFGQGGMVSLSVPGFQNFSSDAVAIQPDGKILVFGEAETRTAGSPFYQTEESVLVRLNGDGSLDTSFGGTGYVTSVLEVNASGPSQIMVQPDGKILVAGLNGLARFNADGSPDTTFGTGGTGFTYDNFGAFTALSLQANGSIVVASQSVSQMTLVSGEVSIFGSDGLLETSFDVFGPTNVPNPTIRVMGGLQVQSDGRIVVTEDVGGQVLFAGFNPDGTPDTSFGNNGIVDTGISNPGPVALSTAANGDLLVATTDESDGQILLAAFLPDGSADLAFGSNGRTETNFVVALGGSWVMNLFIQPDGNIVIDALVTVPGPGDDVVGGLARFLGNWVPASPAPNPPSGLPPTTGSNAGPAPVQTFTAGAAGTDSTLALPVTTGDARAESALALALGGTTPAAPMAGPAVSQSVILAEGLQPALGGTDFPGATTGLHSLDLTYFGSGGGSEKERGDAASTALQDAAFVSLTDDL